jgi:putative methionine-R-sulfoxide reductase with GAF domain
MSADRSLLDKVALVLAQAGERKKKAKRIAETIRMAGTYRWVGIYDVDIERDLVTNVSWSGPSAPAYPVFSATKGLTSRAIATKKTVNVGDVTADRDYLTALGSTRSEIIIPIVNEASSHVIGTIDVESEQPSAFDSAAQTLLEECAAVLKDFWMDHR